MRLVRTNFPAIIPDNDEAYMNYLEAVLNSVDPYCCAEITAKLDGYLIRIAPGEPVYQDVLLKEIKTSHTLIGMVVEFSKSMKKSSTVTFFISNK